MKLSIVYVDDDCHKVLGDGTCIGTFNKLADAKKFVAADALAEAANNHILDPNDPHTFLDLVKALREYREVRDK